MLDAIRKDLASQVGGLLWEGIEINLADDQNDDGDGPVAVSVPAE